MNEVALLIVLTTSPVWSQTGSQSPSVKDSDRGEDVPDEEALRRFRAAITALDTARESAELKRHLDTLRNGFPQSRSVLIEALGSGSARIRGLVLKLLGDHGDAETDLAVVVKGLDDRSASVRMAGVLALRQLGPDAAPAILRHLRREREPNIRKLAVRNLKTWGEPEVIPDLVRLLSHEKHPGVRKHMIRTLEHFSGKRYGDDTEAWVAYAEEYVYRKNEKRILEYSRSRSGKPRK